MRFCRETCIRGGTDASGVGRPSYGELEALVGKLQALVAEQQTQIADLLAQLDGNSRNSSRPPSSGGLSKPPVDPKKRSLRRRSGRKQGGQEGHEGARLLPVATPDEQVAHPPERCEGCHADLAGAAARAWWHACGVRRWVFAAPARGGEHR